MSMRSVTIRRSVIDSILTYAKMAHPKESILILQGKAGGGKILIDNVIIPPLATHGQAFSGFPLSMLPSALSIMGVAHSHPSGVLAPSIHDLNHFYGRIMIITAYPYDSEYNVRVFDGKGNMIRYEIS